MKKIINLIILIAILAMPIIAFAEIMVASALEWLSCSAEIVAVGKIKNISITKGIHSVIYEDVTVEIHELLKGDIHDKEITFCLRTLSSEPNAKSLMNSEEGILFFLSSSKDHGSEHHLDNKLVPTSLDFPLSIINLSSPSKFIFNMEFENVKDRDKILLTCRRTLNKLKEYKLSGPNMEIEKHYLKIPWDTQASKTLYSGSTCYLYVPNFMSEESEENFY